MKQQDQKMLGFQPQCLNTTPRTAESEHEETVKLKQMSESTNREAGEKLNLKPKRFSLKVQR